MDKTVDLSVSGILFGILFGVIGFFPLYLASRSVTPGVEAHVVALALAAIGIPLVVMLLAILVCSKVAPQALLCFGCAMAGTLLILTSVYTCGHFFRRR